MIIKISEVSVCLKAELHQQAIYQDVELKPSSDGSAISKYYETISAAISNNVINTKMGLFNTSVATTGALKLVGGGGLAGNFTVCNSGTSWIQNNTRVHVKSKVWLRDFSSETKPLDTWYCDTSKLDLSKESHRKFYNFLLQGARKLNKTVYFNAEDLDALSDSKKWMFGMASNLYTSMAKRKLLEMHTKTYDSVSKDTEAFLLHEEDLLSNNKVQNTPSSRDSELFDKGSELYFGYIYSDHPKVASITSPTNTEKELTIQWVDTKLSGDTVQPFATAAQTTNVNVSTWTNNLITTLSSSVSPVTNHTTTLGGSIGNSAALFNNNVPVRLSNSDFDSIIDTDDDPTVGETGL